MNAQIAGHGAYDNARQQVDPRHEAARVSLRPPEVGAGGSYSAAFASGVMAAGLAAGSAVFAFRWTDPTWMAVIRRVRLTVGTDATAFAQGSTIFDLIRASIFAAQYTGGATISLTGKSQAKGTRFTQSRQQIVAAATGNIAVANTATLVAGTPAPTFDSNPMAILVGSAGAAPATIPTGQPGLLIDPTDAARTPLELIANEGFVIRATVPATGTWKFGVEVDWDEIDPARYLAT